MVAMSEVACGFDDSWQAQGGIASAAELRLKAPGWRFVLSPALSARLHQQSWSRCSTQLAGSGRSSLSSISNWSVLPR